MGEEERAASGADASATGECSGRDEFAFSARSLSQLAISPRRAALRSSQHSSATGVASAGPTFVKKRHRANIRKRDDAEDAVGEESAVPEARQAKRKGLAFSSQRADKAEVHAFEASR